MNTYRIQKVRCAVAVALMGGEQLAGEIFLNPASRFRSAPQEPAEFLNEHEEFFALAVTEGQTVLVSKARVEWLIAEQQGEPDDELDGAVVPHPVMVAVTVASGAVLRGTMSIDAPPSHARLLDFLNSSHDRFLRVADAGRVVLINRQAIDHVHEQD